MSKIWIVIFYCSLFLSLALMFIAFKIFHTLYGKELMTRIDPVYSHTELPEKSTEFLFLGDSRIDQWKIPESVINPDNLLNLGIDAQTSAQVLYRAKDYFAQYYASITFIQAGINDLKTIGFYPEKKEYIEQTTISNIKKILILCRINKSEPVFISIFPAGRVELKRRLFWNKQVNESILKVNSDLMDYCRSNNIKTIDSYKLLSSDGLLIDQKLEEDCLHLNKLGYQRLNKALNTFLIENRLKN